MAFVRTQGGVSFTELLEERHRATKCRAVPPKASNGIEQEKQGASKDGALLFKLALNTAAWLSTST